MSPTSAIANAHAVTQSSAVSAAATGPNIDQMMEVDAKQALTSRANQSRASLGPSRTAVAKHEFVEQELIPPTSRLTRLPIAVPFSPNTLPSRPDPVAISAYQNNSTTYSSQDVHHLVNSSTSFPTSTAPRFFGQAPLETTVSSSSQPLTNHVLNHPIRRPRTSHPIFQSSTDLAAHYGIPQILPPAPRTTPTIQQHQPALQDFQTLSANYLNMLSKQPTDNNFMVAHNSSTTISPADLEAPVVPCGEQSSGLQSFEDMFGKHGAHRSPYPDFLTHVDSDTASPEFHDEAEFMSNLFTPSMPELDDFTSPFETPYSDFLSTPLFTDDAMLTSPSLDFLDDRPLFGGIDYSKHDEIPIQVSAPQQISDQPLYTISPNLESPFLDFEVGNSFSAPSFPAPQPEASPGPSLYSEVPRRSKATGIRKGITPDALLGDDAPIQSRKYVTPSATSRKAVPAAIKKRKRTDADVGEEDLDEEDKQTIEAKRQQNTLAARRSRRRKLEVYQKTMEDLEEERRVCNIWMTRTLTMQDQLKSLGVYTYDYKPDEFKRSEDA